MSATKELIVDVWDMIAEGETPQYISKVLNVPISFVYDAMEVPDPDQEEVEIYSPYETINS
jgi:hypothetical protein